MDPFSIGLIGLGAWNAISGGRSQGKADRMQQRQLDMAERQYNELAPFRQQAMGMLPGIEGDSGLPADFGMNRGNPYSRGTRTSSAMPMAPQAPPRTAQPRMATPQGYQQGAMPPNMPNMGGQAPMMSPDMGGSELIPLGMPRRGRMGGRGYGMGGGR